MNGHRSRSVTVVRNTAEFFKDCSKYLEVRNYKRETKLKHIIHRDKLIRAEKMSNEDRGGGDRATQQQ